MRHRCCGRKGERDGEGEGGGGEYVDLHGLVLKEEYCEGWMLVDRGNKQGLPWPQSTQQLICVFNVIAYVWKVLCMYLVPSMDGFPSV